MPENAYLSSSSYGDGWKCSWGYRKTGETCVAIKIPANAYLNSYGYDWECDRGFKALNQTCVAVKIPENGYFVKSTYGAGWECERGYLAKNEICIALQVPVNAHLDFTGHEWECNPPYNKQQNKCELSRTNH